MRVFALALLFAGCKADPIITYLDAGQFECVEDACPTEPGDVDPCDAFSRPMVCVDAATVALSGIDVDGETVGCDAVCVATCDDDCDDGSQCRDVGIERLCVPEECGNGYLDPGETCDDGNEDDTDDCLTSCELSFCGDGELQGGEECDDGSANGDDQACTDDCVIARCGDGLVGPDEACDDANDNDEDACRSDCTIPGCGDGILGGEEACDDGNEDSDDGCSNACDVEVGYDCSTGTCNCDNGYTGAACDSCDVGYQDEDEDGICLSNCELSAVFAPCEADTEICAIVDGQATCGCADGYQDGDNGCEEIPPCRRYVIEDASGSGASWSDASGSIQAMVDAVGVIVAADPTEDCEVWVGEGTWTYGDLLRTETLTLADNVTVRGGFAAVEEELVERELGSSGRPALGTVLDGQGNAYHVVTAANGATLDGFIVTGGLADQDSTVSDHGWGGGVYARDVDGLTLSDILFEGNEAERGAGVSFDGGSATLVDCSFDGNLADYSGAGIDAREMAALDITGLSFAANTADDGHGAAIYAEDVNDLFATDTSFFGNVAQWDGSAVWFGGAGTLTLSGTDFVNNGGLESGCLGGAVYAIGEDFSLSISDALFLGNASMMEGGAVYVDGASDLSVSNSTFSDNISQLEGTERDPTGGRGGAITAYNVGSATMDDVSFDGNEAFWDGGAIYMDSAESLTLTGTSFTGNTSAGAAGAGLYLTGVDAISVTDGIFTDNVAHHFGASMYASEFQTAEFDTLTVRGNESGRAAVGGLYLYGVNQDALVSVTNAVFEDNVAHFGGAAIAVADVGTFTLSSSVVNGNVSTQSGGSITVFEVTEVNVTDTAFEDNTNGSVGALFVRGFGALNVDGSEFTGNHSDFGAGLTACAGDFDRGSFGGTNSCDGYDFDLPPGTSVDAISRATDVTVTGTVFTSNTASGRWGAGAAIYDVASATLDDVQFLDHTGSDLGVGDGSTGALHLDAVLGDIVVSNATFSNNDSGNYFSSGIYARGSGSLTVTDSTFTGSLNYAHIGLEDIPSVIVERSDFSDALGDNNIIGGGITLNGGGALEVRDSTFAQMSANVGGAGIWYESGDEGSASVLIERSTFTDLSSDVMGAGVSVNMSRSGSPGAVSIVDSTFGATAVDIIGGAARIEYIGSVDISGTSFTESSAGVGGGAVRIYGANGVDVPVTISDSSFANTEAGTLGGALNIENVESLAIADTTFDSGSGGIVGGAIRATVQGDASLTNVSFIGFESEYVGGAVAIQGSETGTVTVVDAVFEGNATGVTGGAAVFDYFALATVSDSRFEGNGTGSVAGVGSAIQFGNVDTVVVERTAFIDNLSGVGEFGPVGYTGALTVQSGVNLSVYDSLFSGNLTENSGANGSSGVARGGAIHFAPDENVTGSAMLAIVGSTFEGNTAADGGSAVAVWRNSSFGSSSRTQMSVTNSIIVGNAGLNAVEHTTGLFEGDLGLADSAIQEADIPVDNVFGTDPLLFGGAPTETDPYRPWRLMPGSPALNAGMFSALSATDLEGMTRSDPPDLGAFEAP